MINGSGRTSASPHPLVRLRRLARAGPWYERARLPGGRTAARQASARASAGSQPTGRASGSSTRRWPRVHGSRQAKHATDQLVWWAVRGRDSAVEFRSDGPGVPGEETNFPVRLTGYREDRESRRRGGSSAPGGALGVLAVVAALGSRDDRRLPQDPETVIHKFVRFTISGEPRECFFPGSSRRGSLGMERPTR